MGSRATHTGLGREKVDQECPECQPRRGMTRPSGHSYQLLNLESHVLIKRETYLKSGFLSKTSNMPIWHLRRPFLIRDGKLAWPGMEGQREEQMAEVS